MPENLELLLQVEVNSLKQGDELEIGIRPEDLFLSKSDEGMSMKVEVLERLGGNTLVYGSFSNNQNFCASLRGDAIVSEGEIIKLEARPSNFHVFDNEGNAMKRLKVAEINN